MLMDLLSLTTLVKRFIKNTTDPELQTRRQVTYLLSIATVSLTCLATEQGINGTVDRTYVGWAWDAGANGQQSLTAALLLVLGQINLLDLADDLLMQARVQVRPWANGLSAAPSYVYRQKQKQQRIRMGVFIIKIWHRELLQNLNYSNNNSVSNTWWNNDCCWSGPSCIQSELMQLSIRGAILLLEDTYCFAGVAGYSAFGSYTGNKVQQMDRSITQVSGQWLHC